MKLSASDFRRITSLTPLVSIDLIVRSGDRVLLGMRKNRPAKRYWFVPGGRVRKNETLTEAGVRLGRDELGVGVSFLESTLLGVYEHFYADSVFGDDVSTHYIAIGIIVDVNLVLDDLPADEHDQFEWWQIETAIGSPKVHEYTKEYLRSLDLS